MSEWPIFGLWLTCAWYITAPALLFFILINNNNNFFASCLPPTCIYPPKTPEEITWGNMLFLFINRKIWFPVIKQIDVYLLRQKCWVDFFKFQTWSFLCLCQSCFIFSYNLHHHLLFLIIFNKLLPSFLARLHVKRLPWHSWDNPLSHPPADLLLGPWCCFCKVSSGLKFTAAPWTSLVQRVWQRLWKDVGRLGSVSYFSILCWVFFLSGKWWRSGRYFLYYKRVWALEWKRLELGILQQTQRHEQVLLLSAGFALPKAFPEDTGKFSVCVAGFPCRAAIRSPSTLFPWAFGLRNSRQSHYHLI